jgi:hypothetical protein
MYLGLDDGKFITEMMESVVLAAKSFDFGGGVSVVEVGDGMSECMIGGSGAVKKCVEPGGDWLGDILG